MATSPATRSATQSGAAKDDALGFDGVYTFTIADLLANDPGGAAKVNESTQFFFGDDPSAAAQAAYLELHGITDNGDGTYTLTSDAEDFTYMVQIGNKGTWSQASVDVNAPPAPEPTGTQGNLLFEETFEGYSTITDHGHWELVSLTERPLNGFDGQSGGGAWATGDAVANFGQPIQNWGQVNGEIVLKGSLIPEVPNSIEATSGDFWLDTQNSPGGINISNWFHDENGGAFQLSFDLGIHDFGTGIMEETNADSILNVMIDGKVIDQITYDEVLQAAIAQNPGTDGLDQMAHFEYVINDGGTIDVGPGDGAGNHLITFEDVTPTDGYVGFALDTIQVHDWIV